MPRKDIDAIAKHVTENTAAVIIEPVQGLAGAYRLRRGISRRAPQALR